jgi:3'-phosphoadenosine 5'-phosphosulfate (PAPS) 3'-phosphatase
MSGFNRRVASNSAPLERLPELASRVCALAEQAGEKIMRFYHNGASVTLKADASPLTAADEASHAFLVKSLQGLLPDVPVVSEESEGAMDRSIGHSTLF